MTVTDRAARALDRRLEPLRLSIPERPAKGWLRAIRDALGMTTRQYAARLGVSQPRVLGLEKGETDGTIALETLRRAAEALDCRLVYALVPNESLVGRLRRQAELNADEQLRRMDQTMGLENQALTRDDRERQRELLIDQLLRGNPHRLWDDEA